MKRIALIVGALLIATLARPAFAHDPFEITTVVRVDTDTLAVETTMARSTARRLVTGDHRIRTAPTLGDFSEDRTKLEALAPSFVEVLSDGQRLRARSASARLTAENDVEMVVTLDRPSGAALHVRAKYLRELSEGYTQALSAVDRGTNKSLGFRILTAAEPDFEIPSPGWASHRPAVAASSKPAEFVRFLVLGLEHILVGYDHLFFLAGILLACRGMKNLLALVTCFTLAHSVTLALATLGHVSVPSRLVEPLIALSIVLIGLENLFLPSEPKRRLTLTFAFGVVHGLGFAGVLEGLAMPANAAAIPLFSFNLGIELGQVAVAALMFPLFSTMRGSRLGPLGLRVLSAVVAGVGVFWLCERLVTA